jgi:type IV pilus assembly protein PilF
MCSYRRAGWLTIFAFAALTSVAGCSAPGSGSRDQEVGNSGTDMVTESDEPEARKRARLRIELASGYFEQGKTKVALDEIKQAINADANYSPAYNLRGLVYMRMGENKLAEGSFRRALELTPKDSDVAHNLGWLMCQQGQYDQATPLFDRALSNPVYGGQAKTWMAKGVCMARAGQTSDAIAALTRAYQLDAGNPVTGYNLAQLLFQRGEYARAQFYIRRLNNSELANAETLWLGARIEQRMGNRDVVLQLGDQLRRRFPQSKEFAAYERGAFNE